MHYEKISTSKLKSYSKTLVNRLSGKEDCNYSEDTKKTQDSLENMHDATENQANTDTEIKQNNAGMVRYEVLKWKTTSGPSLATGRNTRRDSRLDIDEIVHENKVSHKSKSKDIILSNARRYRLKYDSNLNYDKDSNNAVYEDTAKYDSTFDNKLLTAREPVLQTKGAEYNFEYPNRTNPHSIFPTENNKLVPHRKIDWNGVYDPYIFAYSAFHDDRRLKVDADLIVVLGLISKKAKREHSVNFKCAIYYSHSSSPEVVHPDMHFLAGRVFKTSEDFSITDFVFWCPLNTSGIFLLE